MPRRERRPQVIIADTEFIFRTNFAGDPARDTFGSSERKGNVVIPTKEMADALAADGFNVGVTKPRTPEEAEGFIPTYHIVVKLNYDTAFDPPRVYIVKKGHQPVLLTQDRVYEIDSARVENVMVACNPYVNERRGTKSLYISTMYVEVSDDDDPFASRYMRDDELPFN